LNKHDAQHLIEHWIEHNVSHSNSFRERAKQIEEISRQAATEINQAADLMDKCTEMLKKAKDDLEVR
jgi:predicted metallo-beta-lactamase superfamily hydrolase